MVTEPHFQLTTKDHAILQTMLERHRGPCGPFVQLLEQKVRASTIYFRDDIPPGVVTLNSRLTYWVNGVLTGPHLIVQSVGEDLPDYAVSIHTIRGLALLGLAERASITVALGQDEVEELRVEDVLSQPEAEARVREIARWPSQGESGPGANVVSFLRKQAPMAHSHPAPEDDDPGPQAA